MEVYKGTILTPKADGTTGLIPNGAMHVDGGIITAIGTASDMKNPRGMTREIDFGQRVMIPGLIDTHVHAPQYPIAGMHGLELLDWLDNYTFPAEKQFPETVHKLGPIFFDALKKAGTTTAVVFSTVHMDATDRLFQAARDAGSRAIIGKVMMDDEVITPDFLREDTDRSVAESRELAEKWHGAEGGRLLYAFTPRFALTSTTRLMEQTAEAASDLGTFIQTHLSENPTEVQTTGEFFPDAANYTDIYHQSGLLGEGTVLAHSIYLSAGELDVIRDTGAGVAHCPTSNEFLISGTMPMRFMRERGIPIGLGSDIGGGPTESLLEVMRSAVNGQRTRGRDDKLFGRDTGVHSAITVDDAFRLATLGGAEAISMQDEIGSLEVGKQADFNVVEPTNLVPHDTEAGLDAYDMNMLLRRIVYRGTSEAIREVYVGGKQIVNKEKEAAN